MGHTETAWDINRLGLYAVENSHTNVIMGKGSDISVFDCG